MTVGFNIHARCHEVLVEFVHVVVFALKVNHRSCFTFLIYKEERRDVSVLGHLGIVGTEGRGNVYYTSTVVGGHVVAENHSEGHVFHLHEAVLAILSVKHLFCVGGGILLNKLGRVFVELCRRLHPRHKLFVAQPFEFAAGVFTHNAVGYHLVAMLVAVHRQVFAFGF